ncbi:MAG: phosphate uptake regulator PhoU [Promethearchaeota archaeon]|nr:MAG: phosphate uptake regulator PhoU [Candidatus Lokiarchaeota archaeon]
MSFHIETRKVQKTGGSSYIISLPKVWIDKHHVEINDTLGILSQPDGNLLITPQIDTEKMIKVKEIIVDDFKDDNYLYRILIGTYIMGFSKIVIKSSKKFEPFIRECITNFTQIAIGPEVVEESSNFIIIKDLLNPTEMPFEKTIKRMYILVHDMHEDAIKAFETGDKNFAEEVIKRDNDVDRLLWLIGRQSHIVLRDIILCQKMGITLEQASHYHSMSKFLERIGDHAVRIAKNVLLLDYNKIDKDLIKNILNSSKISLTLLDKSLDAWLQKSIILANENIEAIKELIQSTEKITFNTTNIAEFSIAIGYIIESIRRTGEYAGDISEIIINNLV